MKPCIIYVVRHGESVANRDNISAGQADYPLTELGEQQAQNTKKALNAITFDEIYSSDLQRAIKTTEIIAGRPVPKTHQLEALRERSFGKLEGQSDDIWQELVQVFNDKYADLPLEERWKHDYADYIEGNTPLSARFLNSLRWISKKHPGKTVLVGTHAGGIRTTLVKLGYAEEWQLPPLSFANGAYIVLDCDGKNFTIQKVTGVTLGK